MLDDAVDAYLDSVSERAFDEPLLALLRAQGFVDIHLVHGGFEFGNDVIAKRDGRQWAFQSKAGDINLRVWRELRGQLDDLRTSTLSHIAYDTTLELSCVLVCTGRLVGGATLAAQDYDRYCRERGEPSVEFWGRDRLVGDLTGNPTAVLRGALNGPLLAMFGGVEDGSVDIDRVERFSRRWADWEEHSELAARGIVELSLLADALARQRRIDLACQLALSMVRAAWAAPAERDTGARLVADAAAAIFKTYAMRLFDLRDQGLAETDQGPLVEIPFDWVTYPVKAIRTAELLALLALRLPDGNDVAASEVVDLLAAVVTNHPGCAHPLGDRYATSLIPIALALNDRHPTTVAILLSNAAAWLGARYGDGLGLASSDSDADEEVARVFGDAFEWVTLARRTESYLACVLVDVAAVLGMRELYDDIRNDTLAVGAVPSAVDADDVRGQYLRSGTGVRRVMPDYAMTWPADGPVADHHLLAVDSFELGREGRFWDQLAVQAVLRDRNRIPALAAFVR
jgi:hypothetical protein